MNRLLHIGSLRFCAARFCAALLALMVAGPIAGRAAAAEPEPTGSVVTERAVSRGKAADTDRRREAPVGRVAIRTRISEHAEIASRSPVAWLERFGEVETRSLPRP